MSAAAPAVRSRGVRANRLRLQVSEDSRLVVRYVRVGDRGHVIHNRSVSVRKGLVSLRLDRWMRAGRYRLVIVALDRSGNASRPLKLRVAVR